MFFTLSPPSPSHTVCAAPGGAEPDDSRRSRRGDEPIRDTSTSVAMHTFGVPPASDQPPPPRGAGTAGAVVQPQDGLSSGHQPHQPLLGKRSRKQAEPRRDPAEAQHLPTAATAAHVTHEEEEEEEEEDDEGARPGPAGQGFTSRFKGVSWQKRRKKCWEARCWDKAQKKSVHLGYYANEEEAARAYQDHVGQCTVPLKKERTSGFKGVSWRKQDKKWRACCWDKALKKDVHLGYFAVEEDAARAYQDHVGRAKESINAPDPPAAPAPAPAGQSAAQHLLQYELEREAVDLGVVGLAGKAGLAPPELQPNNPPPPPPPRRPAQDTQATQAAAARASTSRSDCADAGARGTRGARGGGGDGGADRSAGGEGRGGGCRGERQARRG
jgi:hypothetical protein